MIPAVCHILLLTLHFIFVSAMTCVKHEFEASLISDIDSGSFLSHVLILISNSSPALGFDAMYRSASPFAQPAPDNFPPASQAVVSPGSTTYTTSTGPDGRLIYHTFKFEWFLFNQPSN
jgi:hypothetical protein